MSNRSYAILLNMDTDQFQVKSLDIPSDEKICCVNGFDKSIWIITDRNRVYKWDYVNDKIVQIVDLNQYIKSLEYNAHNIYVTKKYIYFINVFKKDIKTFDYTNNEFFTIKMNKYVQDKSSNNASFYYYYDIQMIEDDKLILFSFYEGKYITVRGKQVTKSDDRFSLTEEYLGKCFSDNCFYEGHILGKFSPSLLEEIESIISQSKFKYDDKKNIGKVVYNTLIKMEM